MTRPSLIAQKWQKYKNILCVRLDNLGDVLMTSPAFRALKNIADRKLTLLTSSVGSTVSPFLSHIDETVRCDAPWVKTDSPVENRELLQLVQTLKQKKFDAAIIFTSFGQNPLPAALLTYLAGIPNRLAYCQENPYALLTDWIPDPDRPHSLRHEVERQLYLVKQRGFRTVNKKLSFSLPIKSKKLAQEILRKNNIPANKKIIVLHPGASDIKRQYSPEKLIKAAKKLIHKGYVLLITGNEKEKSLALSIKKQLGKNAFCLAANISFEEFAGIVAVSSLVISNNTGPVHVAAALNKPVLDLYAKTNPQHIPWKVKHKVLYFDVPKKLQSKNTFLQSFRFIKRDKATVHSIVKNALKLLT